MKFPGLDDIAALAPSEYEREFLRIEYAPGLAYYVDRIDRLLLAGDRALDAGCGAGQWSLALAQRFRHVDAVDLRRQRLNVLNALSERMGVRNISTFSCALERLCLGDAAYDAVLCYSVLMFTDVEAVIREFHRVLRPGGRVYVSLNADGWSRSLAEAKSRLDERRRRAELATLYTTYWQRALKQGLREAVAEGAKDYPEGLLPWEERLLFKIRRRLTRVARRTMAVLAGVEWKRSAARDALCRSNVGRGLFRRVQGFCGAEFVPLLLDDISAMLESGSVPSRFGPTRAYRPEELAAIAAEAGFVDFQWSVEAGLACDWTKPAAPKYPGYYGDELSVWECLLTKPHRVGASVSLQRHVDAARQAAMTPAYGEQSSDPVISNASVSTYPPPLVAYARWQGEWLGGASYMRQLARALVAEETDDQRAVRRIIRFVQQAVFRDPVVQPLLDDGSLPDGLTSLLCARGRCGHTARILVELFQHAGFDARERQLPQHVVAEVRCGDRWVIADADAFKGGIVPEGDDGRLLGMEEIEANPYVLDRFPPTGWMLRPDSRYTRGVLGHRVRGYVDALEPDRRGFVSGYYVTSARGFPPSLPEIRRFDVCDGRLLLSWDPVNVREGRLVGYRVRIGTLSRAWSYDDVFWCESPLAQTACDVVESETTDLCLEASVAEGSLRAVFASVTAVSDRVQREPRTYFWPSEEVRCEMA